MYDILCMYCMVYDVYCMMYGVRVLYSFVLMFFFNFNL